METAGIRRFKAAAVKIRVVQTKQKKKKKKMKKNATVSGLHL